MTIFDAKVLALCVVGSAFAQISYLGKCPRVKAQSSLDVNKIAGKWYLVARYPALYEQSSTCNTGDFQLGKNGVVHEVDNFIDSNGRNVTVHLRLTSNRDDPSVLRLNFPFSPLDAPSDCRILGTDYDNYNVFYCCTEYHSFNQRYLFILAKDPAPDKSVTDKTYEVIAKNGLSTKPIEIVDQTNCPWNSIAEKSFSDS